MTQTEYAPPAEVPTLEQLRADMKKAAQEHPEYGSCPNCIKAVRIDKFGRLRDHSTPELAQGNIKATFRCPGSHQRYAEFGEFGQTWDLRAGRWAPLDVDVPVLFVAHPLATENNVELPIWQLCGVPAQDMIRRTAKVLLEGTKWRIDLLFEGATVTGHLIRVDGDAPVVQETRVDEAAFGGIERVIGHLCITLYGAEFRPAVPR